VIARYGAEELKRKKKKPVLLLLISGKMMLKPLRD